MGNLCGSSFTQQERVSNNRYVGRNINIPNTHYTERERVDDNEEKFIDMEEYNSKNLK